jgi:arylsulfatase A-like enzyme
VHRCLCYASRVASVSDREGGGRSRCRRAPSNRLRVRNTALGLLLAAGGLASLLWQPGCHGPPPPRPNVILIVLDTLRADRVGTADAPGRTPFLARWFADGIIYDRAYSPSSWTVPSIASLFVGQFPAAHQVRVVNAILPEDALTFAEVLTANGYVAGGFSTNLEITADAGFGQGFDAFELLYRAPKDDARSVNQAALEWLDGIAGREQPVFLYLQYMEPHSPYRPHSGLTAPSRLATDDATVARRINEGAFALRDGAPLPAAWRLTPPELERIRQLYDGEVDYLDAMLAALFTALDERGLLHDALVVVTADHGEQLGEHGLFSHGNSLFEETIRVPLLVRLPGASQPVRVAEPVSLAGVAAALLSHLRLPVPQSFQVAPVPLTPPTEPQFVYSEVFKEDRHFFLLHRQAVIGRTSKLLVTADHQQTFFDLGADPGEVQALAAPPFAAALRAALPPLLDDPTGAPAPARVPIDDTTRDRLRALGYTH